MKQSVWCVVVCAVLYVHGSEREDKDQASPIVYGTLGYGLELILKKFDIVSTKLKTIEDKIHTVEDKFKSMNDNLRSVEDKIQSVEIKVKSMNDKLEDKIQILSDNLLSVDKKLQMSDSKLLKIESDIQDQRASQRQIMVKLEEYKSKEEQIATSLKDHRSNQEKKLKKMFVTIQKLDKDFNNAHNCIEVKLQSVNGKLESVENNLQKMESKLLEHRSSQEKSQIEMFTTIQNLEVSSRVALNLSEVHNRNQQNVQTVLQKFDKDINDVHNITRQILNTLPKQPPYSSCKDVPSNVSGTYLIRANSASAPFEVYCEQEVFGGGWIVFQYRYDGSLDFYRGWNEFRDGFGDLNKEFWLGLEKLHQITSGRKHELIVELKDFSGNYKYARYDAFEIGSESEQYDLKELGSSNGTADDAMIRNKGSKFSTEDRDNDEDRYSCAQGFEGAWWHGSCTDANLNGRYRNVSNYKSMSWYYFNNQWEGLSYSRMMIRELE